MIQHGGAHGSSVEDQLLESVEGKGGIFIGCRFVSRCIVVQLYEDQYNVYWRIRFLVTFMFLDLATEENDRL